MFTRLRLLFVVSMNLLAMPNNPGGPLARRASRMELTIITEDEPTVTEHADFCPQTDTIMMHDMLTGNGEYSIILCLFFKTDY